MKFIRGAAAFLSLGLSTAATTAPPPQQWTVFGTELGKPPPLPTCKKKVYPGGRVSDFIYEDDPAETCYEPASDVSNAPWQRGSVNFPLQKMPLILSFNSGFTLLISGRIEGLRFSTLGYGNTDAIIAELTVKFGLPTLVTETTSTVSGISVPATHAEWELPNLYVSYLNVDREIEHGVLRIETPVMQELRRRYEQERSAQRTAL